MSLNTCTTMCHAAQGIAVSLAMITKALGGNYVNFGVFKLYKDTALDAALDMALKMALSMPLSDVLAFPKVALAYFQVRSRPLPPQHLPHLTSFTHLLSTAARPSSWKYSFEITLASSMSSGSFPKAACSSSSPPR